MLRPSSPRLLLLLPTVTYRTVAFVEAARRLGADLTVASERPSTFERANPTGLVTLDFADPTHAAAQAREFARAHPVHGVVAVDDDTAVVAAAIAEALGLRGNPVTAAAAARDKHQQRQLLATAGVAVPRFELLTIAADPEKVASGVAYPCVLKPLRLSASRGVIRADTPAEFVAAFERVKRILEQTGCARSLLVEEFVPGREVAVEGLVTHGALHVLAIFDKPDPLDGPFFEETIYVTPSRLPGERQAEIRATTARAAHALGLTDGPIHAELRLNDGGTWMLEVAARSIGGLCSRTLRFGSGISLEELILQHAAGLPVPSHPREQAAAGVMMLPIRERGRLRAVEGQHEAKAVPGVEGLVITIPPGEPLVPLPEGDRYLGFMFARAASPDAVEAALRRAHAQLRVVTHG